MTGAGRGPRPLRVLFTAEGNAETFDSWSGVSRSVIRHLRAQGQHVEVADADLYGLKRLEIGLRSFAWPRKRWWVRYHLHEAAFAARTRAAEAAARSLAGPFDVMLQVGATFDPPPSVRGPLALYCDSNIELSRRGAVTGQSEGAMLTAAELAGVLRRERRIYERAAVIFTMSEMVRQSFIDDFGISPDRLVTVHCGPNIDVVPDAPPAASRAGAPTVLFVGRDFERKGGPVLLEAFRLARERVPSARLRVVGGRPRDGVAPPGVEFLGFLSRDTAAGRAAMDDAYRSASLFCIPTRYEPFGTSFVEAMLYGVPCVGPRAWAVPEIILDGETGFLVAPEDPRAYAEAIVAGLTQPALVERMGTAARRRALEHFSWRAVGERMARALEEVARPGGAPD